MTNKTDLPTTKTLSTEEMKSVRGGLLLGRNSLRSRPTARFGVAEMNGIAEMNGVAEMNGFTGFNSFGSFGVLEMNG